MKGTLEQALSYHKSNKLDEAEKIYRSIIKLDKKNFNANQLLGTLLLQQNKFDEAESFLIKSYKLNSSNNHVLNNLGLLFKLKKNYERSVFFYEKNIEINNNYQSKINLSSVYFELNNFSKSLEILKKLEKEKDSAQVQEYIAINYFKLNETNKAKRIFENLIKNDQLTAEGNLNFAKFLFETKSYVDASKYLDFYILNNKNNYEAFLIKAGLLRKLNKPKESFESYIEALKLLPISYKINKEFILFLIEEKNYKYGISYLQSLLKNNFPEKNYFILMLFYFKILISDWSNYSSDLESSLKLLEKEKNFYDFPPLNLKYFNDLPFNDLKVSKTSTERDFKKISFNKKNILINDKIKIGFLSGDFKDHAVSYLLKDFFKYYDSSKFELFLYSNCYSESKTRLEIINNCKNFFDIDKLSDHEAVNLIVSHNLDIIFDLSGHTKYNRISIFINQLAKFKVNYLGFPGTMGSEIYDYIIADKTIISENDFKFYAEKIIFLPLTYQPYSHYDIGDFKRSELGCSINDFLFVAPHRVEKLNPITFDIWLKCLSIDKKKFKLLLGPVNKTSEENILEYSKKFKIGQDQIIFLNKTTRENHLKVIKSCDLFLDTFPYTGHTTTAEALFTCKVPVVTLCGNSFASRISASLLKSVGIPELITHNINDYQNKILELTQNNNLIKSFKNKLLEIDVDQRMKTYVKDFEKVIENIINKKL